MELRSDFTRVLYYIPHIFGNNTVQVINENSLPIDVKSNYNCNEANQVQILNFNLFELTLLQHLICFDSSDSEGNSKNHNENFASWIGFSLCSAFRERSLLFSFYVGRVVIILELNSVRCNLYFSVLACFPTVFSSFSVHPAFCYTESDRAYLWYLKIFIFESAILII